MGIAGNEWGFQVGTLPKGARDKISDVPGGDGRALHLGRRRSADGCNGAVATSKGYFHEKCWRPAMSSTALARPPALCRSTSWARMETPILFTNTLSVGTVETALVKYMLERNPDICETTGSVNPVVCECNDSGLNDIRGPACHRGTCGCRSGRL